jgi:hypothetical protein
MKRRVLAVTLLFGFKTESRPIGPRSDLSLSCGSGRASALRGAGRHRASPFREATLPGRAGWRGRQLYSRYSKEV